MSARAIPAFWSRAKGLPASTAPNCFRSPIRTSLCTPARLASRTSFSLSSFETIEASSSTRTLSLRADCASERCTRFAGSSSSFFQPPRKRASVCEPIPVSRSSIWTRVFWIASPTTCRPSSRRTCATGAKTLLLPAPAMPWIATVRSCEVRISRAADSWPSLRRNP